MSTKAVGWALEQRPKNATAKLVLIALADYAGDNGESWYGRKKLAQVCLVALSTLDAALDSLAKDGFIAIEPRHREDGSFTSNLYRVLIPGIPESNGGLPIIGRGTPAIGHHDPISDPISDPKKPIRKQRILELRVGFIEEACVKYPQWSQEKVERLVESAVNYYLPEMRKGKYQDLNLCVWNNLADKAEKELANGQTRPHPAAPLSQFTRGAGGAPTVGRTEAERYAARVTRYQV